MKICNKKHLIDHIVTGPDIPERPTSLPYMTRKQIKRLVHSLIWHRCIDVGNEFRNGNRVYLIDSELDLEGILDNDIQRIEFQNVANELCDKFENIQLD